VATLIRHVGKLPATLRRSLTWDRGLEMARHKTFTVATDVQVSLERGTKEKHPTCCCGNISLEQRTCPSTRKRNSIEFRLRLNLKT
jgi:hypothetical protein